MYTHKATTATSVLKMGLEPGGRIIVYAAVIDIFPMKILLFLSYFPFN